MAKRTVTDHWLNWIEDVNVSVSKQVECLKKCVVFLYGQQTELEQDTKETIDRNSVGFDKFHAAQLSDIAVKVKTGQELSGKETRALFEHIPSFHTQLETVVSEYVTA